MVERISNIVLVIISVAAGILSIFAVLMFTKKRRASYLSRTSQMEEAKVCSMMAEIEAPYIDRGVRPFETEHLARYYAEVLFQSKVAFWFSILFGSFGFFVIIYAALFLSKGELNIKLIQGAAGTIIDAVASIFFVQSKRAKKSMTDFFDKLRKDRQQVESRKLCEEIHNPSAKDAVRVQLSLYYAGMPDNDKIGQNIAESFLK